MGEQQRLGELLVELGALREDQLEQALQMQLAAGGRLGTVLVELELAHIDAVGRALAQQHGVPEATQEALAAVAPAARAAVPATLVQQHTVVPLRLEGKRLDLAMRDPRDVVACDQIAFATGLRVQPFAAAELRLFYYIERYYRVRRNPRYLRVPDRALASAPAADRRRYLQPAPEFVVDLSDAAEAEVAPLNAAAEDAPELMYLDDLQAAAAASPAPVGEAVGEDIDVSFEDGPDEAAPAAPAAETAAAAPADGASDAAAPDAARTTIRCANCEHVYRAAPPLIWTLCPQCGQDDEAEEWRLDDEAGRPTVPKDQAWATLMDNPELQLGCANLREAPDRDAVLGALVTPAIPPTSFSVLFAVRQQLALGLLAHGAAAAAGALQEIIVPLTTASLLQRSFAERAARRSRVGNEAMIRMIVKQLGLPAFDPGTEVLVAPLVLGQRVFNLACYLAASGQPFGEQAETEATLLLQSAALRLVALMRSEG